MTWLEKRCPDHADVLQFAGFPAGDFSFRDFRGKPYTMVHEATESGREWWCMEARYWDLWNMPEIEAKRLALETAA